MGFATYQKLQKKSVNFKTDQYKLFDLKNGGKIKKIYKSSVICGAKARILTFIQSEFQK